MEAPKFTDSWRKVGAYCVLALAVIIGFIIQGNDRQAGEDRSVRDQKASDRKTCLASLDNRQQLADVIGQSVPVSNEIDPSLSPEIQKLILQAQDQQKAFLAAAQLRFSQPLEICETLTPKIESRIILKNSEGVALVPIPANPPDNSPGTPATSTPRSTTTQSAQGGVPGPPGPQGPPGPPGPPGSSSSPGGSTEEPTTTTTSPSLFCVNGHCIG